MHSSISPRWRRATPSSFPRKRLITCKRIGVAVLGMEVPHAHIHLVPLQSEADLDFRKPKLELKPERFAEIAQAIAREFDKQ